MTAKIQRKLLLLRHGQAEDKAPGGDFFRNLTPQGRQEVQRVGKKLRELGSDWRPSRVLCSGALRARQTWEELARACAFDSQCVYFDKFFHASASDVFSIIAEQDSAICNLLLIGHNPCWTEVSCLLSDSYLSLGTASATLFTGQSPDWEAVSLRIWEMRHHLTP